MIYGIDRPEPQQCRKGLVNFVKAKCTKSMNSKRAVQELPRSLEMCSRHLTVFLATLVTRSKWLTP